MRELSLFTGAGGGVLGSKLLGWKTIGYVEINDYCQRVIAQRIKDGILDEAPIFGDIRAFLRDGYARNYHGMVDVITAGFPCQPFSIAGKGLGIEDERNMWPETLRVIREVGPLFALLENVPGLLTHEYFGEILGDLAESGYGAKWMCLSASEFGAPHSRDRLWIVAYANGERCGDAQERLQEIRFFGGTSSPGQWMRGHKPAIRGTNDGLAFGLDRLRAIGNGQVPIVVKTAWEILSH